MFTYYVPFIAVRDGELAVGYTFVERDSAIETITDVKSLIEDLKKSEFRDTDTVVPFDWKRIQ